MTEHRPWCPMAQFWDAGEYQAPCQCREPADSLSEDRARDQRATGPSPEEERRARGLDEEQGIYRSLS